jgi:hypothetical protein
MRPVSGKNSQKQAAVQRASLQENLDVAEIKEGVVVVKDGSLRLILAVSSINFALKSQTEQEAIVYGYQRFLNSLDFPVQIVISTRKFDIKPYIHLLERKKKTEKNQLLRNQMEDYMSFVQELVNVSNIMSKLFYVIVPFYPVEASNQGIFDKITTIFNKSKEVYRKREDFETYKNQLFQRAEEVRGSLSGTGVRMAPLNTQELIEMFYNYYNPSEFEHVTIPSLRQLDVEQ